MMNAIFDWCVHLLEYVAPIIGLTYQELNVWLFVIIHPAITLGLFIAVVVLLRRRHVAKKTSCDSHSAQ
jgi:hypothetical protein